MNVWCNMTDITDLVKKYNDLCEAYRDLSNELDNIKAMKSQIQTQIIDVLKANNLEGAVAEGKQLQIIKKRQYSLFDTDAFIAVDDKYHTAALFSVNSNKLNAFLNDLCSVNEGELPEDIKPAIKCFEYETLSVRKSK